MSDSFIFYDSYYQAIEELPDEMKLEMLEVIIRYGLYGEEPGYNNPIARMLYELIRPTIDANQERRANGTKGGRPKKPMVTESKTIGFESENHRFPNQKPMVTESKTIGFETENHRFPNSKPNVNVNVNGNVNVNDNANQNDDVNDKANVNHNVECVDTPKRTRFVAPTTEEVRSYSIEKGLGLDAERFVDYYAAKGWKVGSSPMKDWKAAARNWARQDKERGSSQQKKTFGNFETHTEEAAPTDLQMALFRRQQQLGGKR